MLQALFLECQHIVQTEKPRNSFGCFLLFEALLLLEYSKLNEKEGSALFSLGDFHHDTKQRGGEGAGGRGLLSLPSSTSVLSLALWPR
jgi:hypothetical protein